MRLTTRGLQYRHQAQDALALSNAWPASAHVAGRSYGALTGLARSSPRRPSFGGSTPAPRDGCPCLARNARCGRRRSRARMCATYRRPRASGANPVKVPREHRRTLPPMLRRRIVTRRKSTVGPQIDGRDKSAYAPEPTRAARTASGPGDSMAPSRSVSNTPFDVPLASSSR